MMRFLRFPRRVWRPAQDDWREAPFEAALLGCGWCLVDVAVVAASVRHGTDSTAVASITTGNSGEAITAGQVLAQDTADSKYYLADANSGTAERKKISGVAVSGAPGADQKIVIQTAGIYTVGGTAVVGVTYIMSATPGAIAPDADAVSGWTKSILGVGLTSTTIKLSIFNSGAAVP